MKKTLALTFLLGALAGGGIMALFQSRSEAPLTSRDSDNIPSTEAKTTQEMNSERILDIPKYPESSDENNVPEESGDMSMYESPDDYSSESTQIEKFERTHAGEMEEEQNSVPEADSET